MDIKSERAGLSKNYFWYRNKLSLIDNLFSMLPRRKEIKILNIGVGTGDDLGVMKNYGSVFVIDIDFMSIRKVKSLKTKMLSDACSIACSDSEFDIVAAFDVLEHLDDDKMAVSEFMRVLKPGGFFLLTVPALPFLYGSHDRFLGHVRRYGVNSLKSLVKSMRYESWSCGGMEWKVIKNGYWMSLLFFPMFLTKVIRKRGTKLNYVPLPSLINSILFWVGELENYLITRNVAFPIGTSIYGVYQKCPYSTKGVCQDAQYSQ